ncbi:MAG: SpoIIE family protein phosphatase [Acidobacteriota bacterium]
MSQNGFNPPRILIADDQEDVLAALRLLLKSEGFLIEAASSPAAIIESLETQFFDLLLMDLNYARDTTSGQEGLDLVARIKDIDETLPVVVMTAWGSIEIAVEAMRRGVRDFVLKPWDNPRLLSIIHTHVASGRATRKKHLLERALSQLSLEIAQAADLPSLLALAAERLHQQMASESISIIVRSPRGPTFSFAAGAGISSDALASLKRQFDSAADHNRFIQSQAPALALSIKINDAPTGFIRLGEKITGEQYTADELLFLSEIIEQLGAAINNLQWREQERDILEAREIQQRLLPEIIPQIRGCQIATAWQPARSVSGDYYDVIELDESRAALAIADVSGKGLPAAMLMSNAQAALRAIATDRISPREMCEQVNRVVCGNTASNKFITFFYAILDTRSRKLIYSNAGHNLPLLMRPSGEVARLSAGGPVLGFLLDYSYEQGEIDLRQGDRLTLFTDGVVEATDESGEEFGEERLIETIRRNLHASAEGLKEAILGAVLDFGGRSLHDDATMIVVSIDD